MTDSRKSVTDALFQRGVLMDLHLSCWTGQTKNRPSDFGLDKVPDDMTLGRKRIIRKALVSKPSAIVSTSRWFVDQRSFPFPLSRARFVPYTRLKEVVDKLEEYKKRFDEAVEALLWEYDSEKEKMLAQWERDLRVYFAEKVNVEEVLATIRGSYPTANKVRSVYNFSWSIFDIRVPPQLQAHVADEKAHEEMEKSIQSFVRECVGVLRGRVAELVEHINELRKGRTISRSSITSIQKTVDQLKAVNFFNDREVNESLEGLRTTVGSQFLNEESLSQAVDGLFQAVQGDVDDAVKQAMDSLTGDGEREVDLD